MLIVRAERVERDEHTDVRTLLEANVDQDMLDDLNECLFRGLAKLEPGLVGWGHTHTLTMAAGGTYHVTLADPNRRDRFQILRECGYQVLDTEYGFLLDCADIMQARELVAAARYYVKIHGDINLCSFPYSFEQKLDEFCRCCGHLAPCINHAPVCRDCGNFLPCANHGGPLSHG